jgi:hypothetical protein
MHVYGISPTQIRLPCSQLPPFCSCNNLSACTYIICMHVFRISPTQICLPCSQLPPFCSGNILSACTYIICMHVFRISPTQICLPCSQEEACLPPFCSGNIFVCIYIYYMSVCMYNITDSDTFAPHILHVCILGYFCPARKRRPPYCSFLLRTYVH